LKAWNETNGHLAVRAKMGGWPLIPLACQLFQHRLRAYALTMSHLELPLPPNTTNILLW